MSMNKLEELSNKLEDKATRDAVKAISEIHESITATEKAMLPEVVFKEGFLEFFKDVGSHPNKDGLLLKWLELSGGIYNEVDVVDVKGDVVFTVPGICTPGTINEAISNNVSFGNIVTTFNNKLNRTEAEGINYLNGELNKLVGIVGEGKDTTDRWVNVLTRYDDKTETQTNKDIATELNKNLGLELDYD